jgi:hypothetical protein
MIIIHLPSSQQSHLGTGSVCWDPPTFWNIGFKTKFETPYLGLSNPQNPLLFKNLKIIVIHLPFYQQSHFGAGKCMLGSTHILEYWLQNQV